VEYKEQELAGYHHKTPYLEWSSIYNGNPGKGFPTNKKGGNMEFVRVANQAELPANTMKIVVMDGKEILLSNVGGIYHAITNRCTHAGGSLGEGILEGNTVRCPRHGARFDLRTGAAVGEAKIGFIKIKVSDETCYPVKVEAGEIYVGIEKEPVKAAV
jgi:3-phenylpropionate/trans-cinnamate dioxygenase ferredoxin component